MDIIKRKINLEPFINRRASKFPYLGQNGSIVTPQKDETSWGKIGCDIIIAKEDLLYPFATVIGDKRILRFRNFYNLYRYVSDFIAGVEIQEYCKRGWRVQKLESEKEFWEITERILETLPTEDLEIGKKIYVREGADAFYEFFGENAIAICRRIYNLYNTCEKGEASHAVLSIPYMDLRFLVTEDTTDMGIYSTDIKEWQKHKIYSKGDIVSSEGGLYRFKPTRSRSDTRPSKDEELWEFIGPQKNPMGPVITAIAASRLEYFKRRKTSVDDSGKRLPFIEELIDDTPRLTLEYMPTEELRYKTDTETVMHVLDNIAFVPDIENATPIIYSLENSNNPIYPTTEMGGSGTITFTYYTNRTKDSQTNTWVENTGIKYTEMFPYTVKESDQSLPYISVDYTRSNDERMEGFITYSNRRHCIIEYQNENSDFYQTSIYRKEGMLHKQFFNEEIDGNIYRGMNTATERLNILGEVKTMEDLENYRNNLFKF